MFIFSDRHGIIFSLLLIVDNINTWGGRLWGRCLTGSTNGSGSFCKKFDLQYENSIVIFMKEYNVNVQFSRISDGTLNGKSVQQ